ncbi:MAG: potassium transporter TrkH [Nitrospinae bacterium]|nr:potassium transporter TrkH [Nitrospinota bacterium]
MNELGKKIRRRLEPSHWVILLYAAAIFIGGVALRLPVAQLKPVAFIDTLFISASAITVTGLSTVNVAESFTFFGQVMIMVLIQLGGLGILTVSSVFTIMLGRAVSMRGSGVFFDSFSISHQIDFKKLMKAVLFLMFSFEALGTAILTADWAHTMGWRKAFFAAMFHSVAAFCNAGISIFPNGLIGFEKDAVAEFTIAGLIIAGGLGFITISEIYRRRHGLIPGRLRRMFARQGEEAVPRQSWSLQTRVVLVYSALLVGLGMMGYFAFELNNTLEGRPFGDQLMLSFFHSVGARTAGFQNVDFADLNNTTLNMIILLMFIGTAPGSTGGGVKVTTFAIMAALAVSRARGFEAVHVANRAIPEQTLSRAIAILSISVALLLTFITMLLITEGETAGHAARSVHGHFLEIVFEAVSAFGTVGYSMGITGSLSGMGKMLIILLMMVGKLGPLTIALAVTARARARLYQLSEESVMVG